MEGNQLDDVGVVEPQIDPKELKSAKKKRKAEIRAKKKKKRKAYNKRMKERRKTSQVLLTNDV